MTRTRSGAGDGKISKPNKEIERHGSPPKKRAKKCKESPAKPAEPKENPSEVTHEARVSNSQQDTLPNSKGDGAAVEAKASPPAGDTVPVASALTSASLDGNGGDLVSGKVVNKALMSLDDTLSGLGQVLTPDLIKRFFIQCGMNGQTNDLWSTLHSLVHEDTTLGFSTKACKDRAEAERLAHELGELYSQWENFEDHEDEETKHEEDDDSDSDSETDL
mmetsp:Transcript_9474/g.12402  ORF Transcript_9474/g.12402 Transcript_9474/m.12402 type:complete len:219 (-) Transcript_9474:157-813(-)